MGFLGCNHDQKAKTTRAIGSKICADAAATVRFVWVYRPKSHVILVQWHTALRRIRAETVVIFRCAPSQMSKHCFVPIKYIGHDSACQARTPTARRGMRPSPLGRGFFIMLKTVT